MQNVPKQYLDIYKCVNATALDKWSKQKGYLLKNESSFWTVFGHKKNAKDVSNYMSRRGRFYHT